MTLEDKYKEMFEDGKEEGLAEGEAKGRQEGEATARQTLVSSLYRNGLSVAEIVALAELTEDEVTRIVQSIAAK